MGKISKKRPHRLVLAEEATCAAFYFPRKNRTGVLYSKRRVFNS
jgi:hypothetical protein